MVGVEQCNEVPKNIMVKKVMVILLEVEFESGKTCSYVVENTVSKITYILKACKIKP